MEAVRHVRIHRRATTTREYEAITVVLGDLHLSCDLVNARQVRLAKRLAESHGATFSDERASHICGGEAMSYEEDEGECPDGGEHELDEEGVCYGCGRQIERRSPDAEKPQ